MAERKGYRTRILLVERYLRRFSDESHGRTMREILEYLQTQGITTDRRTLYLDFEEMRSMGMDIIAEKGRRDCCYYLASREFELAELKLLVDAVRSFRFMTVRKSRSLIGKLKGLVSVYEAEALEQQISGEDRYKSLNEEVYYNVDRIHAAIHDNRRIRFQYFQWTVSKEMALRHGGDWYHVSPWGLVWDDENYYLIAYDPEQEEIRHYRVDKMLHIEPQEEPRDGEEQFRRFDITGYSRKMFGMFGGETEQVKLLCDNDMAGVMIDRFGTGVTMIPVDERRFCAQPEVVVSDQFIGWVISLGDRVRILEPASAVDAMKETARRLSSQYV